MVDLDFAVLDAHPECRQVLLAYHDPMALTTNADAAAAEFISRGFRPRVREVVGVATDQLARLHGKLIAHGLLQVEIAGRNGGMLYQLTVIGRRACLELAGTVDDETLQLASA